MISRRAVLAGSAVAASAATLRIARAANTPGVTATSVKIGNTMPYSGPASTYGVIGRTESAFFKMLNEQGGVDGHTIDFISYDDGYSPPKTVEQVRRLVEEDQVDFCFQNLGTPCNSAIAEYLNHKQIPHLFVGSGASKWADIKKYPWTMGFQPGYRTEAQIYAKHMLANVKDPKLAILYQNDDFGKDYPIGVRDILGDNWDKIVVKTASYETTDPTIDSQIVEAQSSGANVLLVAAIPKFAAQSISKVYALNWKPAFYMTNVAISVGGVLNSGRPRESHRHAEHPVSEGPDGSGVHGRSRHEAMARLHGEIHAGRRRHRRELCVCLCGQPDDGPGTEAVQRRFLTGKCHEAGGEPARLRGAGDAAGDQDQHDAHGPPPHYVDAVREVGRQDLGALR